MKIFQIVNGFCHWCTPFKSLSETEGFPPDCIFVEAPDYVNEQWGFDDTQEGDARFIHPEPPEGWAFDDDTGTFYPLDAVPQMLADAQNAKQEENKAAFARFLENHPLTWVDGKQYGVTMEDQTEISLNMSKYQLQVAAAQTDSNIVPILQWHAIHEACTDWTLENLTALALAINDFIYPWFQLMNQYKAQIFAETDRKAVPKITFDYRTDEEKAADEEAYQKMLAEQEALQKEMEEAEAARKAAEEAAAAAAESTEETSETTTEESTSTEETATTEG